MRILLLKLKVAYLRLWSRYYSKMYNKYSVQKSLMKLIVLADSMKYQEIYETTKELHKYYQNKLSENNTKIFCVVRELDLLCD